MQTSWLYVLFFPLVLCKESAFIMPVLEGSNVEFYDYNGVRYGIFLDRVIFEEAKQACISKDGYLVEYRDESVPLFIAQALAESAVGFSTLWIGGVYKPATPSSKGVWRWVSGELIDQAPLPPGQYYPMTSLPFWVTRPRLDLQETACLVTDRNNHNMPLIDGVDCLVRRPFICALPQTSEIEKPTEVGSTVQTKQKKFHVYRANYAWAEALAFCSSMGYKLAIITKPEEFEVLQNRMRRFRPIIESAWIGGKVVNGRWVWVSTNEEIEVNGTKNGTSPWFRPEDTGTEGGCLLADRHLCDYIVYLEAKCDRKRNVICQQEVEPTVGLVQKLNGSNIFMSTLTLTWQDAQDMCKRCLDGGSLFQLAVKDPELLQKQVQWLFTAMSVLFGREVRHVWLNGRLQGEEFKWGRDPSGVSKETFNYTIDASQFSSINGEHGFIVYCPGNFKLDPYLRRHECLNLDRENLKHYFLYGLDCGIKQHFICMGRDAKAMVLQDTCKHSVSTNSAMTPANRAQEPAVTTPSKPSARTTSSGDMDIGNTDYVIVG